jgi:hypothetical protein
LVAAERTGKRRRLFSFALSDASMVQLQSEIYQAISEPARKLHNSNNINWTSEVEKRPHRIWAALLILEEVVEGFSVPKNIVEDTSRPRKYINATLSMVLMCVNRNPTPTLPQILYKRTEQ